MKKVLTFILLTILTININAQDSKVDRISLSFSWTPIYYGPNNGVFRLDDVNYSSVEANINYKILNRISVSSGIGYQGWHKSYKSWGYLSVYDPTKSEKSQSNNIRIPFQINYHLTNDNSKIIPYLKTEIVNEFEFHKTSYFQDDILHDSYSFKTYRTSLNIGLGNFLNISKSIMLITEASIGTYVYRDPFSSYQIKLKLGILLK